MRALTICQPYASLIVGWESWDESRRKLVENRDWRHAPTWRGEFLIHAGTSTQWLKTWSGPTPDAMPYGAILGMACLVEVVLPIWLPDAVKWIVNHEHFHGPMGLVLDNVRRFREPIPWKGAQGWFAVPDVAVAEPIAHAIALPSWRRDVPVVRRRQPKVQALRSATVDLS